MLDEILLRQSQRDLRDLELGHDNIHVHLAISPLIIANDVSTNLELPEEKRTHVEQLISRHRNSQEISLFLLHLRSLVQNSSIYKMINDTSDLPISMTTFPNGKIPLFVEATGEITESVLRFINRQIFYLMQTLRTTISGILSKLGPMWPFGKLFRCEKYFQSQPANMGVGPHPIFQLTV